MDRKTKGILCILTSAFCFALMNMFVRLSGDIPSIEKSFFRNLVASFAALMLVMKNRKSITIGKEDLPLLFLRSAAGTVGILCNFYAVDHLILSDATMLNKNILFIVFVSGFN